MDEFREYLVECGLSDLSIRQYMSSVASALKRKSITAVLHDASKSASTRNTYWCALKLWGRFKEDLELLMELEKPSVKRSVKATGTKIPSKTIPLTEEELASFMEALGTYKEQDAWMWPVVSLMISLGLRAGVDLCGLMRASLVDGKQTGIIALATKRDKVRRLPLDPVVEEVDRLLAWEDWDILAELISNSSTPGSLTHRRSAYAEVVRAVKLVAVKAGLDPAKIKTHRFRHNFGKYVYEQTGHDLLLTQRALGHSSPNTTQIYVSADDDKLSDVLMGRKK